MSRLTDRISYLQGLAEGMKLNPDKDSHKLILGILEVLGEVGESFEALAESHGELSDYVESIDEDLADLEADLYDDEDEELAEDDEDHAFEGQIEYECPHCGATVEIDPDEVLEIMEMDEYIGQALINRRWATLAAIAYTSGAPARYESTWNYSNQTYSESGAERYLRTADYIERLGYELSDDEIAFVGGTSELYRRDEE